MIKDFVTLADLAAEQIERLLSRAIDEKALFRNGRLPRALESKALAMVFEKPSLRTRVSFETAMTHLGGHALYLTQSDIGLGTREPVADVARVLGRMCDGIMARTFSHAVVEELAAHAPVPVINALTDNCHPCQAMADMMTVREHLGAPAGKTLAFIGDGNNVARSLAIACGKLGMTFVLACPGGYELEAEFADALRAAGCDFEMIDDAQAAAARADVIYTDTWVSMGQEDQKSRRVRDFGAFQVNAQLLSHAREGAVVMHCLPAHRGYEISAEVFEANAGIIMDQAENRLHFQRTLLSVLLSEGGIA